MKQEIEVLKTMRRASQAIMGWRALVVLGVLTLALASAALSATQVLAKHGDVEVWPAYYEEDVVSTLMYPVGHKKSNPNFPSGCWSASPKVDKGNSDTDLPEFYVLFVPGATQMYCPDGSSKHDMVATAVPGDPGYNPNVELIVCLEDENYVDGTTFTSEQAVLLAIDDDKLDCDTVGSVGVRLSPVVLGP